MINNIFEIAEQELGAHLKETFRTEESKTIISTLREADGSANPKAENKVVFTLVNTRFDHRQREKLPAKQGPNSPASPSLNLSVLVTSNFADYGESLKYLSETIQFFNDNPVLIPEDKKNIEKLTIELQNLSYEETRDIWQTLGCSYLPSAVYKIRVMSAE